MNPYQSPQLDPAGDANASYFKRPTDERLGLEHFVLYAAGVVVAACLNPLIFEAITNLYLTTLFSRYALEPLFQGAGLAAIGLLALRRLQGRHTFPTQVGHWLLLVQGASCLAEYGFISLTRQLIFTQARNSASFVQVMDALPAAELLLWLVVAVVPLLALLFSKGQPAWQLYLVSLAANFAWWGVRPFFGRDENLLWFLGAFSGGLLAVLLFLVAAIGDLRQPQKRDELHWTGVAFQLAVTVLWKVVTRI